MNFEWFFFFFFVQFSAQCCRRLSLRHDMAKFMAMAGWMDEL